MKAKVILPDPCSRSWALRPQRADKEIPVSHHISRPLANTLHDPLDGMPWFATTQQGLPLTRKPFTVQHAHVCVQVSLCFAHAYMSVVACLSVCLHVKPYSIVYVGQMQVLCTIASLQNLRVS